MAGSVERRRFIQFDEKRALCITLSSGIRAEGHKQACGQTSQVPALLYVVADGISLDVISYLKLSGSRLSSRPSFVSA